MCPTTQCFISLTPGMDTTIAVTPWRRFTLISFSPHIPHSSPERKQNATIASSKYKYWHAQADRYEAQEFNGSQMLGSQIWAQWESRILIFVRIWARTMHPRCFCSRLGHWTCFCWAPANPPATTRPCILRLASVQRCLCSLRIICSQIIAKHPWSFIQVK